MIKYLIAVYLFIITCNLNAQTVLNYQADLDDLYAVLKRTPSFRDQVTGEKLRAYDSVYNYLRQDTSNISTDLDIFYNLAQLFFLFRDNHLGFYQVAAVVPDSSTSRRNSKPNINLDSLESILKKRSVDSVEGIYYYDKYLKIGLFRTDQKDQLIGLVLATTLSNWRKGQIAIRLYEYLPGFFRAIYRDPVNKALILYNNEKFRNQSLINSYFYSGLSESTYQKKIVKKDFINISRKELPFQFRNLDKRIQYIRLGNFSAMTNDMEISQQFYDRIKDTLTAPNLIVDMRNNTGGADKVSDKFLRLIQSFSKKGKVFVVINNGTMSQGEIFTLQLKKIDGIRIFGQPTMGTIAYGSNYGKTETLHSGKFLVYMTDMRSGVKYWPFESFGVSPDIFLQNNANWIDQIIREVKKN